MSHRFYCESLRPHQTVRLDSAESHHLRQVMRAAIGDQVVLFDGSGTEATAQITEIGKRLVVLRVGPLHEVSREAARHVVLGVAPPRGNRDRFLLEKAVELGVQRLVWLDSERSVARPKPGALDKYRRAVIEASKQCGRNQLMPVDAMTLDDYWSSPQLPPTRWVADPGAGMAPPGETRDSNLPIALAVGPEGGFTPAELEAARSAGWQSVSLGPRTLRVETAAIALAAMLLVE